MTACPLPGAVRASLDDERPDLDVHVASCPDCARRAAEQRDDARFAAAVFAGAGPSVDADAALRAARRAAPAQADVIELPRQRWTGWSRVAATLLVAILAGAVLGTPGGRAAAASFLERFRAERVAVVPLNLATVDPAALEALAEIAQVDELEDAVDPQEVDSLEAAAEVAGFTATPLDTSTLPARAAGSVHVVAQAPQTVRIAFSQRPEVPDAIRGSALVLHLPGAVVQAVEGADGAPVVVRGEAGSLEATTEGEASLAEVRDALLSLPGLPAETVAALRAIEDWETTLPLPVPSGHVAWKDTTVAGRPAVAFGDDTGLGSALLWHDGDRFVGVGGRLPLSQVRRLAEAATAG